MSRSGLPLSARTRRSGFGCIAGLAKEVQTHGVEIWHALEDKAWGMREFAIVTPDGHRIVFW